MDQFTLEIIENAMVAVGDEMFWTLQRTAQSSLIFEVLDFSVGATDATGELITTGNGVALFLGTLDTAVKSVLEKHGAKGNIHPGDLFITNDPYGGGGTLGRNLLSHHALDYLREGSYSVVLWNSVPRDWENPDGWPERAVAEVGAQDWTLIVVHDIPTGAMKALPRFLDRALAEGVQIVQHFPTDCVPILKGKILRPLDDIVALSS